MTDAEIIARIPEDVRELVIERAACGGWPAPVSPGDFLAWISDEASHQLVNNSYGYALYLNSIALVLVHSYGIEPATLPWQ